MLQSGDTSDADGRFIVVRRELSIDGACESQALNGS